MFVRRVALVTLIVLIGVSSWAADCTSTKPAKGAACTDPTSGLTVTRATDAADAGSPTWLRHEYSRRQAFNSDNSRFLAWRTTGHWSLHNASTYAFIKTLTGPAGDAEPNWHPTDPTKFWYVPNNGGLVLYSYDTDDDSTTTVANFTGRLPWPSAARVSTGAEGSPSSDGRYWAFIAKDSGFNGLGVFTYDLQTDTIIATKTVSSAPDSSTMTPSGNYAIFQWSNTNIIDGVAGRQRAYTRDMTDWTWIDCGPSHNDTGVGLNGHDYYFGVDWTNYADPNCSPADGYIWMKDIDAGFVSQGYATGRINLMATYEGGSTHGVHLSGRSLDLPGYLIVATSSCRWGTCPSSISDKVYRIPMTASPTPEMLAKTWNDAGSFYIAEPQASVSRNGLKVIFASNHDDTCPDEGAPCPDENVDSYVIDLPSGVLTITTTTLANATQNVAYSQQINVTGGTAPYTACDETVGTLPTGLSSTPNGSGCLISGTPSGTGTSNFTEQVTDSATPTPATDTQALSITVNAALQIDTTTLPDGTTSSGYATCLESSGGVPPYTYSVTVGAVPTGLTLASTGCFTGTANTAGTFNFTARVTDSNPTTDDQALSLTITANNPTLTMRQPNIYAGDTYATFRFGATGLDFASDCTAVVKDSGGATVDTVTSTSGQAIRTLVTSALTASSTYSATFTCDGAQPDVTPYPFVTQATPAVGNRTVPIQFGTPPAILVGAARVTVEYDDNAALSTPATVQNTSCGSGCTVSLTIPAGLYYYRWKWQTAADVVLATSTIQALAIP